MLTHGLKVLAGFNSKTIFYKVGCAIVEKYFYFSLITPLKQLK